MLLAVKPGTVKSRQPAEIVTDDPSSETPARLLQPPEARFDIVAQDGWGGSCGKDLSRYESLGFTHAPTFHLFCSWKLSATPHTSSAYEAMAAVMAEQQDEDAGLLKANEGLEVGDLREKSKVVKPGFTTSSLPPTCKC